MMTGINNLLQQLLRYALMILVLATSVPMTGGSALAHKFIVNAWVEESFVFLEAGFSDGTMARNADILVFDDSDTQLLTAKTNDQGEYSFHIPKKSALKIRVKAGMGHQNEIIVPLEEIQGGFVEDDTPAPETAAADPQIVSLKTQTATDSLPGTVAGVSAAEIQQIVEKSLDKKLKPIIRKLATTDEGGPSFKDIVGGLGYILGLVGIGTYFNYRRKKQGA